MIIMVKLLIINVTWYMPQNRVSDTKYHKRCSGLSNGDMFQSSTLICAIRLTPFYFIDMQHYFEYVNYHKNIIREVYILVCLL